MSQRLFIAFLVVFSMNLVDAFQADFHILQGIEEIHQLLYRAIQLPDDVLHGQHHP